jgi:tetratricopeptide (TPR) repeat protein
MEKFLAVMIFLSFTLVSNAQKEKLITKEANELMAEGDYEGAEKAYSRALEINPDYKPAQFNLGNLYQKRARDIISKAAQTEDQAEQQKLLQSSQKFSKQAVSSYENVAQSAENKEEINKTQYNLGNAHLLSGDVNKSIESYKEALRNNPNDEDARYNLAYAQHLQQKQQKQQQQKQDQQQQQQQQNQDQQKQEQQQEQEQKQDQQQQQQQQQLSKEEAQKMLEALMKQEKDLQEKLKKKKRKAQRVKIEKDW